MTVPLLFTHPAIEADRLPFHRPSTPLHPTPPLLPSRTTRRSAFASHQSPAGWFLQGRCGVWRSSHPPCRAPHFPGCRVHHGRATTRRPHHSLSRLTLASPTTAVFWTGAFRRPSTVAPAPPPAPATLWPGP